MLDRERHPVEFPANRDHDFGFRIAEVQAGAACQRALDEQLGRGKRLGRRRSEPLNVRGTGKRVQPVDVLSFDLERLTAGRQDMNLGRRNEDLRGQRRDRINEMLARVKDQKNSLVAEIGDEIGRGVFALDRES